MNWKKNVFENFKLYAVTDLRSDEPDILQKIEAAYRGGADIVQMRSKNLADGILYRLGLKIRKTADRYRKLFFVNDRVDLALALGADGLHLGQEDLPVSAAKKLCSDSGRRIFIGKSTHRYEQIQNAIREKPDYIAVGPVFDTPTKPDDQAVGLDLVRQASRMIEMPWLAIGGIHESNMDQVLAAGARRLAVVRAVFGARDIETAARNMRKKISEAYEYAKN